MKGASLERGDFVFLDFDPQAGHEQAGHRPAFVVSPQAYNQRSGLVLVLPVTNQAKGYPFEVLIPDGLCVQGVILTDQLKSVDPSARGVSFRGKASQELTEEVLARLAPLVS